MLKKAALHQHSSINKCVHFPYKPNESTCSGSALTAAVTSEHFILQRSDDLLTLSLLLSESCSQTYSYNIHIYMSQDRDKKTNPGA